MAVSLEISFLIQGQDPGAQDAPVRYQRPEGAPAPQDAPPGPATTEQPAPGPRTAPGNPMDGCYQQLFIIVPVLLLLYFLMIRPQQKQEKARREMLGKIQKGDRVVTSSGLHGVISTVGEDTVQLLIDGEGKVKVTVDRAAVGRVVAGDAPIKANGAKPTS